MRMKAFNSQNSIEGLVTVPVSQASAQQRAGRAGRVRSGKAYRLYTEEDFLKLPKTTVPEMQRYIALLNISFLPYTHYDKEMTN